MWTPSGAQLGFSFLPSPCVNCTYSLVATFMVNMLKAPVAYPWVHAKAIRWPSGCHDALDASPVPGVNLSKSDPSILDRKSTRLNSSHLGISYAVFCLKKKKT